MRDSFLKTSGTSIVNESGQQVALRGVNLGGWLMMEAYFMHAPNTAEQLMKKEFARALGTKALLELEKSFRDHFIQEEDLRRIARWGFNCVRLPFNYRIIPDQIKYLDKALRWARKCGVYIILDLHAAPGAQNHDWHSDSLGQAALWTRTSNQNKTFHIWEFLADRYKDEPMIAGYDLLNEPVLTDTGLLNRFYQKLIKIIRGIDKKHILFIEGNRWSQEIDILDDFSDDNFVYSIHFYEPLEYAFNFVPHLRYPLKSTQGVWDKGVMHQRMEGYHRFAQKKNRPVHVGEFGVHYREGIYKEDQYVKDLVKCFNDSGFHWNYWTYKAVKHYMFPDGIFSYYPNSPWVHRAGPVSGWNRWKDLWPEHRKEMIASWRTGAFTLNEKVLNSLK